MRRQKVPSKAIYYEDNPAQGEEFKMVQLTTKRDILIEKLIDIVSKVSYAVDVMKISKVDDALLVECFALHNAVREATFDLIDQISKWQQGFTQSRRPKLNETDYILKMPSTIEFFCNSVLSRLFKYLIKSGDILLLPVPRRLKSKPIQVVQQLGDQIRTFCYPSRERILTAYRILQECVSEKYLTSFLPIEEWMKNPWCPVIEVTMPSPDAFFTLSPPLNASPIRRSLSIISVASKSSIRSTSAYSDTNIKRNIQSNITNTNDFRGGSHSVTFSHAGRGFTSREEDDSGALPPVRGAVGSLESIPATLSSSPPSRVITGKTMSGINRISSQSLSDPIIRQSSSLSSVGSSSSTYTSPVLMNPVESNISTANMRDWYLSIAMSVPNTVMNKKG